MAKKKVTVHVPFGLEVDDEEEREEGGKRYMLVRMSVPGMLSNVLPYTIHNLVEQGKHKEAMEMFEEYGKMYLLNMLGVKHYPLDAEDEKTIREHYKVTEGGEEDGETEDRRSKQGGEDVDEG